VTGAGLSGILATFGSFRLVFLVSAGALLVSLPLWSAASVAYLRRKNVREEGPPPTATSRAGPETPAVAKPH